MASKNWRENASNSSNQPRKTRVKTVQPESNEPLRLGPLMKGLAIVLTLVALFFAGKIGWETLQPLRSTVVFFLEHDLSSDEENNANINPHATGLYSEESTFRFGEGNAHLFPRLSIKDDAERNLGPEKNCALFYLNSDLSVQTIDTDGSRNHRLQVSRNGSDESKFNTESWIGLRKIFQQVCGAEFGNESKVNRILLIDIGQVDSIFLSAEISVRQEIESTLNSMREEGIKNVDRLWVWISANDRQRSWFAPELNCSVFSYFVSRGLEGVETENETITLGDLKEHVESSVARWALDYRASVQNPQLITLSKLDLDAVPVVLYKGTSRRISQALSSYHKSELKKHWDDFRESKKQYSHLPHYLSMLESRLIRLEEARYASTQEDTHSRRIFKKLASELKDLDSAFQSPKKRIANLLSIEQLELETNPDRLTEFLAYLYQPPADPQDPNEVSDDVTPAPKATVELSEELKTTYSRQQWLHLVWGYFSSERAQTDPINEDKIRQCITLIDSSPGETGTQIENQSVPWVELQYLRLLRDNIDWLPESDSSFPNQKNAFLTAIRCRQKSESLIRGKALDAPNPLIHARIWHLVREQFFELEQSRRNAEDLLFANRVKESAAKLDELDAQYTALIQKTNLLVSMQETSNEALHVIPQLRMFFVNEATVFKLPKNRTGRLGEFKSRFDQCNSIQKSAYGLINQLKSGMKDFEKAKSDLNLLSSKLSSIRFQFEKDYCQRLSEPNKSAADVVFHATNILTSSLPEWCGDQYREKIRSNLDIWIEAQHDNFFTTNWDELGALSGSPFDRDSISSKELREIVGDVPRPDSERTLLRSQKSSFLAIGNDFKKLRPGGKLFESHFNQDLTPIGDTTELLEWRKKLAFLDFEFRNDNTTFSNLDKSLDVGQQLATIDSILLAHDRFKRAESDCWGAGDVQQLSRESKLPPFVLIGSAEHQELLEELKELSRFASRTDNERKAFDVKGLAAEFNTDLNQLTANWEKLAGSQMTWIDDAPPQTFGDSLKVATRLQSSFDAKGVGQEGGLTMSANLFVNDNLHSAKAFDFGTKSTALPATMLDGNDLGNSCDVVPIVEFRGHQFAGQFKFTKEKTIAPKVTTFQTTHTKLPLGPPRITVKNENGVQGDIVFILDCSLSMTDKVKGKVLETGASEEKTRLYFAKQALRTTIQELADEKRFRFGFYAFGHRNGFRLDAEGGLITTTGAVAKYAVKFKKNHPFEDCQKLYSLDGNLGEVASQTDVSSIIDRVNSSKAMGITPLYFSIKKAIEGEFGDTANEQEKRYIVVLTDGANNQFGGEESKEKSVPQGRTPFDATTAQSVNEALNNSGAELFVARIVSSKENADDRERKDLEQAGCKPENILIVNESDSQSIADRILNAIGRNQFKVTPKGQAGGQSYKIPDSVLPQKRGNFTVATSGVETPDRFDVEIKDGVSVLLKNTSQGLVLDKSSRPRFEPNRPTVDCNLADGVYRIGKVSAGGDRQIAFGFEKVTNLAGTDSDNFSFRPQRIWAQVTDRKSGEKLNLFIPTYREGQYPIAVFRLPQSSLGFEEVDVRLWIAPSVNDRADPINVYENVIGLGETTNEGISCLLERNNTNGVSSITVNRPDGDLREFFIGCPNFETRVRRTTIENGKLRETYDFKVDEVNANFTLSIQPPKKQLAIMQRVERSSQNHGQETDPIFGDEKSVWVEFDGIMINN